MMTMMIYRYYYYLANWKMMTQLTVTMYPTVILTNGVVFVV